MSFISYQPNTLSDQASCEEALTGITSSQILLSREIADPISTMPASASVTSKIESSAQHTVVLQEAAGLTHRFQSNGEDETVVPEAGHDDLKFPKIKADQLETSVASISRESFRSTIPTQSSATSEATALTSVGSISGIPNIGASLERGRTLHKGPRFANPLAKAESRASRAEAVIELRSSTIGKRLSRSSTFYSNPTDTSAVLDDNLLEPCPHILPCTNVSAVLNNSGREQENSSFTGPFGALSNDELICPTPSPPTERHLLSLPQAENQGSVASQLPTEIIQQIYHFLLPADFNSARHTCRSWFINSLERSLLRRMMQRGGFSSTIQNDLSTGHGLSTIGNDDWQMSKKLSRECALGPDWKGNGLSEHGNIGTSAFSVAASVDFTEMSIQNNSTGSAGTLFTVSSCGKYLTVVIGCLVYVYELNQSPGTGAGSCHEPGSLRPITSIICPARVICCSMDASSRRYAIAMLLDGRMGMVCDITSLNKNGIRTYIPQNKFRNCSLNKTQDSNRINVSSILDRVSLNNTFQSPSKPFVFPGIAVTGDPSWEDVSYGDMTRSGQTSGPTSRQGSIARPDVLKQSRAEKTPSPSQGCSSNSSWSMPIEDGPRSFYQNICSEDDPPRSVAICPQRRCVAFGCSSGIELHWVDALTGQDLNRWFPLTSPSDFLFFLPPRKSVDSAKKLRLISSAARPSERPVIATRPFGFRSRNSLLRRLGWGYEPSDNNECVTVAERAAGARALISGKNFERLNGRPGSSDHYRAVPLSDGYHILFTDPASGFLVLGIDAPIGGPTKLLRKIWFQGPLGEPSPTVYSGGSDLSCGVRVVAAFGKDAEQSIWLFSVPLDIFTADQNVSSIPVGPIVIKSKCSEEQNMEWVSWQPENVSREWPSHIGGNAPGSSSQDIWPVKIRGQEIGKCSGLVDLAIDSGRNMTVWAFSKDGISTVWKVKNERDGLVRERLVMRDGTIREKDGDGDIEMVDIDATQSFDGTPDSLPEKMGPFDGTTPFNSPDSMPSTSNRKRKRACYKRRNAYYGMSDGVAGD